MYSWRGLGVRVCVCVFVHKQNVRPTAGRSRHPNNAPDQLALYNTAAAAADSAAQKTRARKVTGVLADIDKGRVEKFSEFSSVEKKKKKKKSISTVRVARFRVLPS